MASKWNCKCKLLSFGTINKKFIIIIIQVFVNLGSNIIKRQSLFFQETNEHPIVFCVTNSLGLCLSFILLLIYKKRNKKKIRSDIEQNNLITLAAPNQQKVVSISIIEKFLLFSLVAGIDYLSMTIAALFWSGNVNYINDWPIIIIFMALFSYLILKVKLYKHHYLSMITIIILGILYNLMMNVFTKENMSNNYQFFIAFFITEIINAFIYFLYKYYMLIKFLISFEILFYQGLIELLFGIITLIITTSIKKVDNFFTFCDALNEDTKKPKQILLFVALIVITFLNTSLIITIIDYFSPFYIFLTNALSDFFFFFLLIEDIGKINKNLPTPILIILSIVFLVLCIFMILVYIEIIQLNFCGLSNMTIKNIQLRAQLDSLTDLEKSEDDKRGIDTKGNEYTIELMEDNSMDKLNIDNYSLSLNE
jgi:cell division protein FtsL